MTLELRHLGSEPHVPLTAHVIVTSSGCYAAVHEQVSSRGAAPRPPHAAGVTTVRATEQANEVRRAR